MLSDDKISKTERSWIDYHQEDYEDLVFLEYPNQFSRLGIGYERERILFTGKNFQGERIIGSSTEWLSEENSESFFHAVITELLFTAFRNRKISYRELLKHAKQIYLLRHFFGNEGKFEDLITYEIDFNDIPLEYQPTKKSFCPEQVSA